MFFVCGRLFSYAAGSFSYAAGFVSCSVFSLCVGLCFFRAPVRLHVSWTWFLGSTNKDIVGGFVALSSWNLWHLPSLNFATAWLTKGMLPWNDIFFL